MHSLGCRKGRPGARLCCPQSHQALTGSGVRTHELMAVMVSPECGPTHLPSPSAAITSWDIPWQHLGCAPPGSASAPASLIAPPSVRCLCLCPLAAPGLGSVGTARLPAPTESRHWLKDPCQPGGWSSNLGKAPCSWSDTSLQAVPGVLGGVTPRVPAFCSTACGSATAFPRPTPSCSTCRRYFPSVAIWAVSFPVPISIFCAGTAACKRSLTGFLGHPRHLTSGEIVMRKRQ